jgi:sterol desaturase/sphingolipid hydroxylase (fatty acid hydroxylase superfamily)
MDVFLAFFEQMPAWQRLAWVGVCLSLSWILEGSFPLLNLPYRKWRHAGVNLVFMFTSLVISLIFTAATVGITQWVAEARFGLLYLVDWPLWLEMVVALLLLDLIAQYTAHYLLHKVGFMWRFHMIHHSDTKVDATTGTRLHPGDFFVREVFALAGIVLIGAPLAYYLVYRFTTVFFTYLSHANVAVPRWLDGPVSWVFVTPNMHKFHHHHEMPWTDTNFGGIFAIWDRIFGTFVYGDPREVRYGLDLLDDATDEDLGFQMRMPFDPKVKHRREERS